MHVKNNKQKKYKWIKYVAPLLASSLIAGGVISCKPSSSDQTGLLLGAAALLNLENTVPVTLNFSTLDDGGTLDAFDCTAGAGSLTVNGVALAPKDLRFYVSEIKMVRADGSTADVALKQDGRWQHQNAVLLDFENASGTCNDTSSGGTTDTNTKAEGYVAEGDYVGVAFTVGLPQNLNKQNNATAPSPLNVSSMYWSWTGGFKFMKHEFVSTAGASSFHPGSSGCTTYVDGSTEPATCTNENRARIRVTKMVRFQPETDVIALNLSTMLSGYNPLDATMSNRMCMPGADKVNCQYILTNLGLNYATGESTEGTNSFEIR